MARQRSTRLSYRDIEDEMRFEDSYPITINLKCELDVLIHILLDGHKRTHSRNGILPRSDLGIETWSPDTSTT